MVNSDTSYAQTVACGSTLTLPDVTHTDSNGTPVTLPGMTPFTATPCGGGGCLYTVKVHIDGILVETTAALDPCVDNEIFINWT